MRPYIVVSIFASALLALVACRHRQGSPPSPLGEVDGYRLVRLAGGCSGRLQFRRVCGRDPWTPSCDNGFRSVRSGESNENPSGTTGTTQIGCEDGWALWTDRSRRIVAFCVLENRTLGIGDLDESSDRKLKRLASQFFGASATAELSKWEGRPVPVPPVSRVAGGSAAEAEMDEHLFWLTHHGVWSGIAWSGWTNIFTWDKPRALDSERDELRLWSPIISVHRPQTITDDEFLEAVRCVEMALPPEK